MMIDTACHRLLGEVQIVPTSSYKMEESRYERFVGYFVCIVVGCHMTAHHWECPQN